MRELGGLGGDGFQMAYVPRRAAASATAAMSAAAAEGANSAEAASAGRKASVQDAPGAHAREKAAEGVVADGKAEGTVAVGAKRKQTAAAERRPAKKPASVSKLAQMAGKAAATERKKPAARQTSSSRKPAAPPVETSAAIPTVPGATSTAVANVALPLASVAAIPAASAEGHSAEVPLPSPVGRRTRHSQSSLQPLPSPVGRHSRHAHALQATPHPVRQSAPAVAGHAATASAADAAAGTMQAAPPVAAKRNQRSAAAKLLDALTPADALGGALAPARGRQTRGAVAAAHGSSGASQQPPSGAEAPSAPQPSSPFRRQPRTVTELAASPQAAAVASTAAQVSSKQSTRRGAAAAAAAAAGSTAVGQETAGGASPVDGVHEAKRQRAATTQHDDELPSQPQLGPADGARRCSKRREGSRAAASVPDVAQAPHVAVPVKSEGPAAVVPAGVPHRLPARPLRPRSSNAAAASLAHSSPPLQQEQQLGRGARQHRPKQMYSPSKPTLPQAAGAADALVTSAVQRSLRRQPGPGSSSAGRTAAAGDAAADISSPAAEAPRAEAPPARTRGQAQVLRAGPAAEPPAAGPAAAGRLASDAAVQHTAPPPAGGQGRSAAPHPSPLVASVAEALRVAPGAQVPLLTCVCDQKKCSCGLAYAK